MQKLPRWHYDEMRHVGADFNDRERVEEYDRRMGKVRDMKREIDDIVAALELRPEQTIVEIGCGTGEVTAALAPFCRAVHAVDISPTMIDVARRKMEEREILNVTFENAGFLTHSISPAAPTR